MKPFGSSLGSRRAAVLALLLLTWLGCSGDAPPVDLPISPQERAQAAFEKGEQLRLSYEDSAAQQALKLYEEALKIWVPLHSSREVAATRRSMGDAYLQLGQGQHALECFEKSLAGFKELADESNQAAVLNDLGRAFEFLGEPNHSFDRHQAALALAQTAADPSQQAVSLLHIARWQSSWGEIEDSLESSEKVIAICRDLNEPNRLAEALREAGRTYSLLGRMQESLDRLGEALSIREAQRQVRHQVGILTEIGWAYYLQGETVKAIEIYQQALELTRADGRQGPAGTLDRLGSALRQAGRLDEAHDAYQQALKLMADASPFVKAHTMANLAELHVERGKPERALEYCEQAIALFEKSRDMNALAHTLSIAARAERQTGELQAARQRLERVLEILDSVRYRVDRQAFQDAFQSANFSYYQAYVDLLMQMHAERPDQGFELLALTASERTRARRLEESWAADPSRERTVNPDLLRISRKLRAEIDAKDRQRMRLVETGSSPKELEKIDQEQEKLLLELDRIQAEVRPRRRSPETTFDLAQVQRFLGEDTLLLYYALGLEKSFLWLLDGTSVRSHSLAPAAEISALARRCHQLFGQKQSPPVKLQVGLYLERLSEILLRPVMDELAGKRLIIVPDGAIQYVPFAALHGSSGLPLLENHIISFLPSAASLPLLESRSAKSASVPKAVAVFADPVFSNQDVRLGRSAESGRPAMPPDLERSARDLGLREFSRLPFTRQEGEAILSLFPEKNRLQAFDFAASRETLLGLDLAQFRILHFATHSLLHPRYPELSGIVLSLVDAQGQPRAGFLRAHDIADLELKAELAVLSACRTGLGKEIPGEGLIGLPQAFMDAGVPSVVVSLWSVSDPATSELMQRFYLGMVEEQLPPPAALRKAQLFMLGQENWSDPYYWAGFLLLGRPD